MYDSDWYVIGAVVIGEARGSTANYAYITSSAKSEELRDGTYYWTFEAVLGGEHQTLTAKSKYANTINSLTVGTVQELRFDGDYVVSIKDLNNSDVYSDFTAQINKEDVYFIDGDGKDFAGAALSNAANDVATELTLQGRTLYVTSNRTDVGLGLASGAKAVTIQKENGSTKYTNFTDVSSAISERERLRPAVQRQGGCDSQQQRHGRLDCVCEQHRADHRQPGRHRLRYCQHDGYRERLQRQYRSGGYQRFSGHYRYSRSTGCRERRLSERHARIPVR